MKFFIVTFFFIVLFVYVTLKSFQANPRMIHKTPLHDQSIRRFLQRINEDRDFMADVDNEYVGHPKNRRRNLALSGNILHPLILRRLAKRAKAQQQQQQVVNDEFMLNNEIYGLDDWPEQNSGSKRNEMAETNILRALDTVPINGGFYG